MDNFITGSSINLNAKNPSAAAPKTMTGNPQDTSKTQVTSVQVPAASIVTQARITGVKTFYAKLHGGSITFLDEQITNWLKDNPNITIKCTNIVVGDIVAKNTEPNLIVTIWY